MKIIIDRKISEEILPAIEFICRKKGYEYDVADSVVNGAINVGSVEFAKEGGLADFLSDKAFEGNWNFVYELEDGFVVSGNRLVDKLHALLRAVDFIKFPKRDEKVREYRVPAFKRYFENYDDLSFAFARAADDFDLEIHMIDMVRVGVENFEINMLYDDIPIQIREREDSRDMYPWWCSYMPTMDMYYETSVSKGIYPDEMLENNRSVLLNAAKICDILGLKPVFTAFEPRVWPERLFRRYPETRGARVDRDTYSTVPEYAPDITHPIVIKHYQELMAQLMADVPNLAIYEIWSQDSNAGFPWAKAIYQKANGPTRLFGQPISTIVNTFLTTLRDASRKVNKDTRIHLNIDWCWLDDEQVELVENLPEGVGLTFGYRLLPDGNINHFDVISKLSKDYTQVLSENIGNRWKTYGPLIGFPTPREAHRILKGIYDNGIENLTMRGGIHTDTFVPFNVNNEVIREMRYNPEVDIDKFLESVADKWTNNEEEKNALVKVWEECDKFNFQYEITRACCGHFFSWTSIMFVSARTLFRKLVMPMVPDAQSLTFQETRYYKPHVFFCAKTDPSWHDISYFNFCQVDEDEKLITGYKEMETKLLPHLEEAVATLESVKKYNNPMIIDLYDRLKTFLLITRTERNFLKLQVSVHQYEEAENKEEVREYIRKIMEEEIVNTEEFIKLLRTTESVLIPTTSGEETTYMYKTPMDNLLVRKIKVMKARMNDEPKAVKALEGSSNDYLTKY